MSYIGTEPTIGNFQVCDAISVVNGQASYTMQVSSVNVVPQSANHMLVSLNGILQKPNSSFTVSGSTITFASNLVTGDVIDFIQILGDVLDLGVPSDNTVTNAKIVDSTIALGKLSATGTKDATTFLRGDNTFAEAGGGIEMAEQWRLSARLACNTLNSDTDVTTNLEKVDTDSPGSIGTGMTESSGVFTFPSTGIYLILNNYSFFTSSGGSPFHGLMTRVTTDNSAYSYATENYVMISSNYNVGSSSFIFDVTNTSTHKVKFTYYVNGATNLEGGTAVNKTHFTFIRLGDT